MKICKTCGKSTNSIRKNRNSCRACENKKRVVIRYAQKKLWKKWLTENVNMFCESCGYNKCFDAIDFHHRDPSKKKFQLAIMINGCYTFNEKNTKKALDEIKKCDILCSNCHKELHSKHKENEKLI